MKHDAQVTANLALLVNSQAYRELRAFCIAKLGPIPEKSWILDAGCGEGSLCRELAALAPQGKVIGLDISADVLEYAHQSTLPSNIEYLEGSVVSLRLDDELFDFVLCCNALKFLKSDEINAAMKELIRVLKPGGTLLIADSDDAAITFNARDPVVCEKIVSAYARFGDPYFGRKLFGLFRLFALEEVRIDAITLCETEFDESSAGYAMANNMRETIVPDDHISRADVDRWYEDLSERHRKGSYFWSYTKYLCVGKKPGSGNLEN